MLYFRDETDFKEASKKLRGVGYGVIFCGE